MQEAQQVLETPEILQEFSESDDCSKKIHTDDYCESVDEPGIIGENRQRKHTTVWFVEAWNYSHRIISKMQRSLLIEVILLKLLIFLIRLLFYEIQIFLANYDKSLN